MGKIFISYRRDDSVQMTERIYEKLIEEYGSKSIFKDVDSIPAGVDFRKVLEEEVQKCDIVLVIIGKKWLTVTNEDGELRLFDKNDFVRIEVDIGLKRGIPVIPLLVDGAFVPKEDALPDSLNRLPYLNALQIRTHPDTENDMKRLIKSIDKFVFPYKNIIKYTKIVVVVTSLSFLGYSQYDNVTKFFKSHLKTSVQNVKTKYDWRYKENSKGEKDGHAIAFFKGTNIIAKEGNYKDGKLEGNYTKYSKNGKKIEDGIYKDDEIVLKKVYNETEKNELASIRHYKDGKLDGEEIYFYKGIKLKFLRKNGKMIGEYTVYDKSTGKILDKDNVDKTFKYGWNCYSNNKFKSIYGKNKDGEKDGKYKEFYENGQLKYENNYKDGKLEGEFKRFREDGTLQYLQKYSNGKLEGEQIFFYKGIKLKFFRKNGKMIGEYTVYDKNTGEVLDKDNVGDTFQYQWECYPNGKFKSIYGKNKDGKKDGRYKKFYEDGKLLKVLFYKNGKLDGKGVLYYKGTTNKIIDLFYKSGRLITEYILYDKYTKKIIDKDKVDSYKYSWDYYNNGKIKNFYGKNKDGEKDGKYKRFYESGKLKTVWIYRNGKLQELAIGYYEDGKAWWNQEFKDGKKDGKYKEFYQNGQLKYEKNYRNGKLDGEYTKYSKDGGLKQEGAYVDGQKEIYAEYE